MMPTRTSRHLPEAAFWIGFIVIGCVFVFASAVQVEFVDPSVPFSEAWNSMNREKALRACPQQEHVLVFSVSTVVAILYTGFRSWRMRLGVLAAGFLSPVVVVGPIMLMVEFVSPLMVFGALTGGVDGEFYEEGMLQIGAMGLWMLLCLVFGVREVLIARRMIRRKEMLES